MKKLSCILLVAASVAPGLLAMPASAQTKGELSIEKAWARATAPGAPVGGGYLAIRNKAAAGDRLVGASSPVAGRMELHEMTMEKDVMKMREVKGMDVPAKGALEFKPGGYHLMFIELKKPLKQGEKVPVTLKFAKAGEVKVEFAIESMGAAADTGGEMRHGEMQHGEMKH